MKDEKVLGVTPLDLWVGADILFLLIIYVASAARQACSTLRQTDEPLQSTRGRRRTGSALKRRRLRDKLLGRGARAAGCEHGPDRRLDSNPGPTLASCHGPACSANLSFSPVKGELGCS